MAHAEGVADIEASLVLRKPGLNGRVSDPLNTTAMEFDSGCSLDGFGDQGRLIVAATQQSAPGQWHRNQSRGKRCFLIVGRNSLGEQSAE